MFDALEKMFKGTEQQNLINELYQGKIKDYVKCLEVCNVFFLFYYFKKILCPEIKKIQKFSKIKNKFLKSIKEFFLNIFEFSVSHRERPSRCIFRCATLY